MKILQRISVCLLATLLFLPSCLNEDSFEQERLDSPMAGAQEFFETTIAQTAKDGILRQDAFLSPGEVTPRWDEASYKRDNKYLFLYVPLYSENGYFKRHVGVKEKKKEVLVKIEQYLCIRKEHSTGEYSGAYITYIPSASYYSNNKKNFAEKTVKSENLYGGFTGKVAYHSFVTGRLLVVDKVNRGVFKGAISREFISDKEEYKTQYLNSFGDIYKVKGSTLRMIGYELPEVEVVGDRGGSSSGGGTFECGKCRRILPSGESCPCWSESNWEDEEPIDTGRDDNYGGGGGSNVGDGSSPWGGNGSVGGGTPGNGTQPPPPPVTSQLPKKDFRNYSKTYVPSTSEKYPKNTIRDNWDKHCGIQGDSKHCMGYIMAYLNKQLNDESAIKPSDFIERYYEYEFSKTGVVSDIDDGYDVKLLEEFIQNYFDTDPFTTFEDAMDNGEAVFAGIRLPNGESHVVAIVGTSNYQGSSHLIYMDSNYGNVRMILESDIEQYSYLFPVGKK